jgi:hypothetical protein
MPPAGFKPTIPASERPQTHALDRAATGIGINGDNVEKSIVKLRLTKLVGECLHIGTAL